MSKTKGGAIKQVVAPEDLHQLRLLILTAEQKALVAQEAQRLVNAKMLDIEHRYGLLGKNATLDIKTGRITSGPLEGEDAGNAARPAG